MKSKRFLGFMLLAVVVFVIGLMASCIAKDEVITLKFFSSNPDKTQGLGLLEETCIQQFEKANPTIKIEQELLQDDPYRKKFQVYLASGELPDVYKSWCNVDFMTPVINGGFAAELNPKNYAGYGLAAGALDAYTFNGKLYGVPMYADTWVLYYNQDLFKKNNVKVPQTYDDLLAAAKAFRAKEIQPCAINGKDGWPLMFTFQQIQLRENGNQKLIYQACEKKTSFVKEPVFLQTAQDLKTLYDAKFFQDGFASAVYGMARSMFVQGKTAMYLMGSWEMGMGTDVNIPADIRKNIRATKFPVFKGKGNINDLIFRIGGGYSVNAKSKYKDAAIKFVNFVTSPDVYAKTAWQKGIVQTPMNSSKYVTGKETQVQLDLANLLKDGKSASGILWGDRYTPAFFQDITRLMTDYAVGMHTPDNLMQEIDKLVEKDIK
jgi:raffinose/stachyose/melibiose transport system substrate-binding protein